MKRFYRCGKRRYPSLEAAQKQRAKNVLHANKPLRIYQCDRCHGWHLTSHGVKAWLTVDHSQRRRSR